MPEIIGPITVSGTEDCIYSKTPDAVMVGFKDTNNDAVIQMVMPRSLFVAIVQNWTAALERIDKIRFSPDAPIQ
jgi:hypothetical protein